MVDGSLHGDAVTAKPRATAQLPISFNWKPCACAPHTAPQATSITSVGARNTFMGRPPSWWSRARVAARARITVRGSGVPGKVQLGNAARAPRDQGRTPSACTAYHVD